MNTPVNFEIAKLLKEKGLKDFTSPFCFHEDKEVWSNTIDVIKSKRVFAPTIAEVVMWLYEKHGIWISVTTIKWNYEQDTVRFAHHICKFNHKDVSEILNSSYVYDTPTEAYEAAIEYTLKNLI